MGLGGVACTSWINGAQWNGRLKLSGLRQPVNVYRDRNGIPYIQAQNRSDALKAQGFITTQDRWLQMELYRRIIQGRAAESFGPDLLQQDIEIRVANLTGLAEKHWKRLNPKTKMFFLDFTAGVNAYIQEQKKDHPLELSLIGLEPEIWSPQDVLAAIYFVSWTHSVNFETEWITQKILNALGKNQAAYWLPLSRNLDRTQVAWESSLPATSKSMSTEKPTVKPKAPSELVRLNMGSNNWAVVGARSQSGKPMMANDPHLDMRMLPGVWYPIVVNMPNEYWAGFSLAGIPGILFGRNQSIAFGLTNAYGDVQDLFYIPSGEDKNWVTHTRVEHIKVKMNDGEMKTEQVLVRETELGPIISDHYPSFQHVSESIVMGWAPSHSKQINIGIDELIQAKTTKEADLAISNIDVMQFNWVLADKQDHIGHRASGLIPVRAQGVGPAPAKMDKKSKLWPSWIPKNEMPGQFDASKGWIGTANQDTRTDQYPYYYSNYFAPSYRYGRIKALMENEVQMDQRSMWEMMLDKYNPQTSLWIPYILKTLEKKPGYIDWYQALKHWDGVERQSDVAPTLYHFIYQNSIRLLFEEYLPEDLVKELLQTPYYWQERVDEWLRHPDAPWPGDNNETVNEHIDRVVFEATVAAREALTERFGRDINDWEWGALHTITFQSPILNAEPFGRLFKRTIPVGGSGETLFRSQLDWQDYTGIFFDSARVVVDLGDDEKMKVMMAGGISSRHFTPWLDNFLNKWADESWVNLWLQKKQQKVNSKYHILLLPNKSHQDTAQNQQAATDI